MASRIEPRCGPDAVDVSGRATGSGEGDDDGGDGTAAVAAEADGRYAWGRWRR